MDEHNYLTGNKGEWSEIYTLLKLIGDGILYNGDGQLRRLETYTPIDEIHRMDKVNNTPVEIIYDLKRKAIKQLGNNVELTLDTAKCLEFSALLIEEMKNSAKGSLFFPEIESFIRSISCYSLKAKSAEKADIKLVLHDLRSGMKSLMGFSIKSRLGGNSTLFNANKESTNFRYKLQGVDDEIMKEFNNQSSFANKFNLLRLHNTSIVFEQVVSQVFRNNLRIIDSSLDRIMGEALLTYYSTSSSKIEEVCRGISAMNPLDYDDEESSVFYSYKIKQFLTIAALGMTAGKPWQGKYDASGGYLVVKEGGEILCYHFYDRNQLEDYLFCNTKFDTPSTSRHQHGLIFKKGEEYYLSLNLQIRFI